MASYCISQSSDVTVFSDHPHVCLCVSAWPDLNDRVDMLCHEQRRVDASFTWQLQGCSDVSESAEALIRTRVNHCTGNPEDTEVAWGEVNWETGRLHHRRPAALQLRNASRKAKQRVHLSHSYLMRDWRC